MALPGTGPGSLSQPEGEPGCACPPGGSRPLPDPAAVRLCRVPDSAPPYDGAEDRAAEGRPAGPGGGDSGDERPGEARHETAAPGAAGRREHDAASGSQPPPGWPGQFAQALAETLAGSRPPRQLVPWTTERARTHIRRLGAQLSAAGQPRIRRVITTRPASDVVEMAVIVGFGPRVRALAVRLEQADATAAPGRPARPARWLCTAVEAA